MFKLLYWPLDVYSGSGFFRGSLGILGCGFFGLEREGFGWMTKRASFGKGGCERGRVNLGGE